MGSVQLIEEHPTGERPSKKVNALLNDKLQHVQWGEYKYDDLFTSLPVSSKLTKLDLDINGNVEVYSSNSNNNGIIGFTSLEAEYEVNEEHPRYVVFGDHTRTFNIAQKSFCVMDNVKVLLPLGNYSINQLLFMISVWGKVIPDKGYARHWNIAKNTPLQLPTKNGEIDFDFMDAYVSELEEERVSELAAYLTVSGFDNWKLSNAETQALEEFNTIQWGEKNIETLFNVAPYKKRFDANKVIIRETGQYPYVVRKSSANGIRGYINEDVIYLNDGNTISFGQDTATMFYQKVPYFTGDKIKIMTYKGDEFNENIALFYISTMRKSFLEFSWGLSSFSEEVINRQSVSIPMNNNQLDHTYMDTLIRAIKKLVIKDVVHYADNKMNATKKVVQSHH